MRDGLKALARGVATLLVLPALASFVVRAALLGKRRALEGSTEALSLIPGTVGNYLRQAFLARTLAYVAPSATVRFGTLFSHHDARLDAHCYVGPRCSLGLVHVGRDVLIGPGVHVPSGNRTHGTDDLDRPIRLQPGQPTLVRIGEGAWIGSGVTIMADVGRHAIIGAGAVVTSPIPDYAIAAGVPARVIRDRRAEPANV